MILGLLLPAALAAPLDGAALDGAAVAAWLADAQTLTPGPELVEVEGLSLELGPGRVAVARSLALPLWSGMAPGAAPERLVGLVLAGPAVLQLAVADPQVALALANRLVSWGGAPHAVGAQLVAGNGLALDLGRLLLVDPTIQAQTRPVPQVDPALRTALVDLWNVRQVLTLAELRPERTVGWDRLRLELLGEDPSSRRGLIDAETALAWVALESDRGPGGVPDDRWLTLASDPLASLDGSTTAFVTSAGFDSLGRPARQALFTVQRAGVLAEDPPHFTGEISLGTGEFESLALQFGLHALWPASLQPRRWLLLRLPQEQGALRALSVTTQPPATALPLGSTGRSAWLALLFDDPVPAGEAVQVNLSWQDQWPLSGHPPATGPQRFLPGQIPDRPGSPARFDLALSLGPSLTVSATGRVEDSTGLRLRSDAPVAFPRVAVGRASAQVHPAQPDLRLLWGGPAAAILDETRRLLDALNIILGGEPILALDLLALPPGQHAAETHGGLVALQPGLLRDLALRRPRPEAVSVLAHELAHLRWGQQVLPASLADQWISEVLAEISAEAALERLGLPAAPVDGLAARLPPLPLTAAWAGGEGAAALYRLGPAALGRGLRARIGPEAHAAALLALAQQPVLDTAAVQAAFEGASGLALGDFFAVWVHGGQAPEVSASWRRKRMPDGRVRLEGELRTDRLFGRVDVPIGQVDRRGQLLSITWVTLEDGRAQLDLEPVQDRRASLVLDPLGWLPLRLGAWGQAD